MKVSRPELKYDELLDFPVKDRFIKLPIDKFLALMEIDPIAPQIALINAINDPQYRQVVACLSRRTGKTFIANTIAFLKAMEPNTNVLVVSPNYSLTNISWNEQLSYIEAQNIDMVSRNKTDREIHLENGSMIKFGSVSQANSLVGRSYDLILFDEAALDGKGVDCYNVQLRPTLDRPNSKVIFISTPRGTNYFADFYARGFSDEDPTWVSIHSTWEDNPRMTSDDVAEAKRGMSRAEFEQEYMANFSVFEGQIYESFSVDKHVRDLRGMDWSASEGIMGIDPGYRDETGGVLIRYNYADDKFHVTWDYCVASKTTSTHAKAFLPIVESEVDIVFVDSAAAQFRADLAADYDIPSNLSKKSIDDGIAYCQALMDNDRIVVCSSCEHVIGMLTNYRWDPNPNLIKAKPLHDSYSHVADAFRYALYSYTC